MQRRGKLPTTVLALSLLASASRCLAGDEELHLPWKEAGLTERQAAAHLLDRFAYGPRPGEVDRLVAMGLEAWFAGQLRGDLPDPEVDRRLERFRSLRMTTREIAETYPGPGVVLMEARAKGFLDPEDLRRDEKRGDRMGDPATRRRVLEYARGEGYRPQRELLGEAMAQKLLRAVYSENQLGEVLTDFWFNHFNVSVTDNECRLYVPSYERDAIRPHVTGRFHELLEATARHPAMLLYLDNARSVADGDAPVRFRRDRARAGRRGAASGINENYARELLELHTLGVDGGYREKDVVEVARAFTGWTTYPPGRLRDRAEERVEKAKARLDRFGLRERSGFVFDGDFLFRANVHDAGAKRVLGRKLPAGRGVEDGLDVLAILAAHRSTARHLAAKIAARFVSDEPPASLVDRLASVYLATSGDLEEVIVALVESPELWSPESRRRKIKSPFELAVSALRVTGARVSKPGETVEWISRMGQPLYAYQAPTGYPDRADFWVNTGSLLTRMNFALQLATGRIAGVDLDLAALYGDGAFEPESLEAALEAYLPLLLPGRDPTPTSNRLGPLIRDPELADKIEDAAPETDAFDLGLDDWDDLEGVGPSRRRRGGPRTREIDTSPLAQVVGLILGSPEFQRR